MNDNPKRRNKVIPVTAVWLRVFNGDVRVLLEVEGEFRLAIHDFHGDRESIISHIAEANGYYKWPPDDIDALKEG